MVSQRFLRKYRLRSRNQFDRVFDQKRSAADDVLIVYGAANDLEYSRLGLVVSKKVGGAVVRNRWKRLLREAFRLMRTELPVGLDLVVLPRAGVEPKLEALCESLKGQAQRVKRKVL